MRRKLLFALVGFACLAAIGWSLLPWFVGKRVIGALEQRGYPHASMGAAEVGLHHLRLHDLKLVDGLEIATVDVDRGLSLLWRGIGRITIRDARVTSDGLARAARQYRATGGGGAPPFRSLQIADSTLVIGNTRTALAASVTPAPAALDVTVSIREPKPDGWSARLRGRVSLGKQIELQAGHVDVTVPQRMLGTARLTNTSLTADIAGTLAPFDVRVEGVARADRVEIGELADLTGATASFRFTTGDGLRVSNVTASTYGGTLTVDPFVVVARDPVELQIHASGLDLARMLRAIGHGHVFGTGNVDGMLALRLDADGVSVDHGMLHSRTGTIRVVDDRLRARLAAAQLSKFAVHERIAAALADFQFAELSATLEPRNTDPEMRVALRGRGRRNSQELDIAVAARGVRMAAERLLEGVL